MGYSSSLTTFRQSFYSSTSHELVHVVVEGQQILGTSLYGRRMASLLWSEWAIEQQTYLADQLIHGHENFMAHDCQKLFFLVERCCSIALRLILQSLRNPGGRVFLKAVARFLQFGRSLAHTGGEALHLKLDRARQVPFLCERMCQLYNFYAVKGFHQD